MTYSATKKTTLYVEDLSVIEDEVIAIENELGTSPKGTKASVKARLDDVDTAISGKQAALGFTAENVANKDTATTLGTSDTKYPSQKAVKAYVDAAIAAAKIAQYPVGSLYVNASNATNPATLLGFGTWVATARGRAIAGIASSGTFNTIGAMLGEEMHTLTAAEMPSHRHGMNEATGSTETATGDSQGSKILNYNPNYRYTTYEGGGGAHNNIQPTEVFYVWKRTA